MTDNLFLYVIVDDKDNSNRLEIRLLISLSLSLSLWHTLWQCYSCRNVRNHSDWKRNKCHMLWVTPQHQGLETLQSKAAKIDDCWLDSILASYRFKQICTVSKRQQSLSMPWSQMMFLIRLANLLRLCLCFTRPFLEQPTSKEKRF